VPHLSPTTLTIDEQRLILRTATGVSLVQALPRSRPAVSSRTARVLQMNGLC